MHQECYGARHVRDFTSWVCKACERPDIKRECCLCPVKGGFIKYIQLFHINIWHHCLLTISIGSAMLSLMIGGALKPTDVETLWVHVTCAWFQPEVCFASEEKMEPAVGILSIPSTNFVKVNLILTYCL